MEHVYPRSLACALLVITLFPAAAAAQIVTAPGAGHSPSVRVIEANGTDRTIMAYDPAFLGGVRVAVGDVNGDGVLDIVTGAGPGGGPHVRIWNGVDHSEIAGFFAYDPAFSGGVSVAAGDVDGDGRADIVTGAGPGGGPHVRIWSGATFAEIGGFFAYDPAFPGGVNVAVGDVNGDGRADIVTGAGPGGGPHVRVWSGADLTELGGFFAYFPAFAGGVHVAAGDINADGRADVITGAGAGGGPHVRIWSGATFAEIGGFFAFDPAFSGGVTVGAVDLTYDGRVEIIAGAGPGAGPLVSIWHGADLALLGAYFAYSPSFPGGVHIGSVGSNNALRITSANSTTFTVGAPGTFTVTTTGGTGTPALSVSGSLPSGVTFTDNGNGTATLAGTPAPGTDGTHNLTFTATSGPLPPVTQSFTLTIQLGPTITSASSATFTVGSAGSHTVTTTGSPTPAISVSGTLPTGLTFVDNGDGTATLSGNPAAGTGGNYPLTITAANGAGTPATQSFTLTVQQAPAFTSASSATFVVGTPANFAITTSGSPAVGTITQGGALPAGVSFTDNGNGTATLAGTPTGPGGTVNLTFTASNGVGGPVVQNFILTVNQSPAITSANSSTFVVGTPGTFTVTATGFPIPTISSTVGLPAGVTFTDNGNGTATIAGTPGAGSGGSYPITISAMNGVGAVASQSFTLTVHQPAAFTSANAATFVAGTPGTFTITTSGTPAAVAIGLAGALPSGVTFTDLGTGSATLAGTPGATTGGTYPLTLTASNGVGAPAVQNFTLTVQQAPAITSANSTTFTVGAAGSFSVTTAGFPAAGVSLSGDTLPAGVTFVDNLNGTATLSGTPGAGTAGPYALTFTAANGVGSPAVQSFTLTVACPAITLSPSAGALPGGTYQQAYSQTFTAAGGTGHTFAVTSGALPPGLALAGGGGLTGSPSNTGNFSFTVTATDSFGCTGSAGYTLTVIPDAQNEAFSGGVGNTQYVVAPSPGSATPAVLAIGTVLSNDVGPGALAAGPANITSMNGGAVAMGPNGAFVYTPAVGFAGPSDTFSYTLTDGNGITDTASVTINLSGVVWYVNSAGGNGDGRSHLPFNTMSGAQTASAPGQVVYVHTGAPTTSGPIDLKVGQVLWGAGAAFVLNGLTIPAGTAPTLTGSVTLANDTLVNSINLNVALAPAIVAAALTGTETVNGVTILGGTTGFNLLNNGGTIAVTNTTISGVSGADVRVSGGTSTINMGAVIVNTSGRSVDIQNAGGVITFSQQITDTADGILLSNNLPAQIMFRGGLSLNTTGAQAFTAVDGGRLTITQNNTSIVNTITSNAATALSLVNTSISDEGLTFRSISTNGAANGIVLNNTGSNGGLTVTGSTSGLCGGQVANGGAAVTAPDTGDCSGGTILNSTAAGISLTDTAFVSLTRVRIASSLDDGITGSGVNGLTLTASLIENNGNAVGDRGIDITNLTGSGGIAASTIRGSAEHNLFINNTTGALSAFNVANSQVASTNIVTGDDGVQLLIDGPGSITASITQSAFTDNKGDHFQAASTASVTGQLDVTFTNNTLTTTPANDPNVLGGGITISPSGSAGTRFEISNNNIQQAFDEGINLNLGTASTAAASMVGTISNNVIGAPGDVDSGSESGSGIVVTSNGAGTTTVAVTGNQVYQFANPYGILLNHKEGSSTMDATVTGNTVANPGTFALNGIRVDSGATATDTGTMCVALTGNSAAGSGPGVDTDIRLRQRFNTTIRLPGYAGANSDTTAVNSFVAGNNPGTDVSSVHNVGGGGGGFVGGAGCQAPQ